MMADLRLQENGRDVKLRGEYVRNTRHGEVRVPDEFVSDGASIPWWVWLIPGMVFLFPRWGKHQWGVVLHDFGYRENPYGWTRHQWDEVMLDAMLEDGTPKARAVTMYRAVRAGAGGVWKRCRKGARK